MVDATTLQRLVQLRVLLQDALAGAAERPPLGRQRALILLDGACEYTIGLSIDERGLKLGRTFPDNVATLGDKLGDVWDRAGLKGVREMHEARNAAQHRGTIPDRDELGRWAADGERFVRSLVRAAFETELDDVFAASAVEDDEIAKELLRAEQALARGDAEAAMSCVASAFEAAREKWRLQRAWVKSRRSRPLSSKDPTAEYVRDAIDYTEDLAEVQPFSPDLGDYVWFQSLRRGPAAQAPVGLDDARRAFVFVLDWVLRWEDFSSRFIPNRYATWQQSLKPPKTGEQHDRPVVIDAWVHRQERWDPETQAWLQINVQLADLPEEGQDTWRHLMQEALYAEAGDAESSSWEKPSLRRDGLVSFFNVPPSVTAEELIGRIERALAAADRQYREHLAEEADWLEAQRERKEEYSEALASIERGGAPMFGEPELHRQPERTDRYRITVPLSGSMDREDLRRFGKALREAGGMEGTWPRFELFRSEHLLAFNSDQDPARAREVIQNALDQVTDADSRLREAEERDERLRSELHHALRERIRPRRPGAN